MNDVKGRRPVLRCCPGLPTDRENYGKWESL